MCFNFGQLMAKLPPIDVNCDNDTSTLCASGPNCRQLMEQTEVKAISSRDVAVDIATISTSQPQQSIEHSNNGAQALRASTSSSSKRRPTPPLPVELIRPPVNRRSEEIFPSK